MTEIKCSNPTCTRIEEADMPHKELEWHLRLAGWTFDTTWGRWLCPRCVIEQQQEGTE